MKNFKPEPGVQVRNTRGEWVPAIEEPYYYAIRVQCRCGQKFWTKERYEEHYAYKHILGL